MCDLALFSQNRIWWPKVWCISICKASNVDSWMKRITSSLLTHLPKSISFLTYVLPIEPKIRGMLHSPQKKNLRVSQQKKWRPPVLKEPENNYSSISTISRIHKRSIRLHVKKPGSRLTFVAFQAPFSLIPALGRLKHGGTKKERPNSNAKDNGSKSTCFFNRWSVNVQTYKRFLFGAVLFFLKKSFGFRTIEYFFLGIEERRLWWFLRKNAGQIPSDFGTCGSVSSISLIPSFFVSWKNRFQDHRIAECVIILEAWW